MQRRTLMTLALAAGLGARTRLGGIGPAWADDAHGTPDEAKAMVEKAVALIAADGTDKAFVTIDDPHGPFVKGDLYVFVTALDGTTVAHGVNKAMIGKQLINVRDANGKLFVQEFISVVNAKGSGWVDYKWPNPVTKKIEDKTTFVEKAGNYVVGCGVYKS